MWTRRRRRPIWPGYATARDAVQYLASACDGAIRRDGHGFSTDHVEIGHWLASLDDTAWGPTEQQRALQLVRVYRHQLDRAGFNTGEILRAARPARTTRRRLDRLHPCWATDPTGVHTYRWWNGARWTELTSTSD